MSDKDDNFPLLIEGVSCHKVHQLAKGQPNKPRYTQRNGDESVIDRVGIQSSVFGVKSERATFLPNEEIPLVLFSTRSTTIAG